MRREKSTHARTIEIINLAIAIPKEPAISIILRTHEVELAQNSYKLGLDKSHQKNRLETQKTTKIRRKSARPSQYRSPFFGIGRESVRQNDMGEYDTCLRELRSVIT
jgi:hypothetical protein